jgi:elongation factor G
VGGTQLFAKVKIRMEPAPSQEKPVLVLTRVTSDAFPQNLRDAALEELRARGDGGGLIGSFPLTQLKITLLECEAAEQGSNEMAFAIAAGEAFDEALKAAGPVLLEPIMKVEIVVPDQYFGDISSDIQKRRGLISKTEGRGDRTLIDAEVPLAELFHYDNEIKSLSQGRASHSMEPHEYAPAPERVAQSFAF